MSYILDALKKADKESKRGTVPDLSTEQSPFPQQPKKRLLWTYLLIAALIINAGILLFWLSHWETEETTTVAKALPVVKHKTHETGTLAEPAEKHTHNTGTSPEPVTTASSETNAPQEKYPHELQSTTTPEKPADAHRRQETISSHALQEEISQEELSQKIQPESSVPSIKKSGLPTADITTSHQQESLQDKTFTSRFRLYDLKDLPSSVKDDLPDFNISVFVYSDDPSSRFVRINGQSIREGQELAGGLTVEKIVPGGIIFQYEDYRFRVGIR